MQHDEFVGDVQHRAHLASRGAAEAAIRATLETLADRIPEATAHHLADQLPREIGNHLRRGKPERLSLEEFYGRVAARETVDLATAAFHARVVLTIVAEAVSPGVMHKVRGEVPSHYDPLFLPERGFAGSAVTIGS
jgi:uncharacterized protein (DUF2267 family)